MRLVSGSCQQCHRRRPQLYVLVPQEHGQARRLNVCPNCALVLIGEQSARRELTPDERLEADAEPAV